MGVPYDDEDLEPFLSEVRDGTLPPRWRLGSLLYLEARETFLSPELRAILEENRESICRALAAEARAEEIEREAAQPRTQALLFPIDPGP
ncbi:MAG TPA: hypothetical protein VFT74_06810 [Isosphaeraceae bacterium]|nr:hypothetical protein [Isosphaeraceae bacterium]